MYNLLMRLAEHDVHTGQQIMANWAAILQLIVYVWILFGFVLVVDATSSPSTIFSAGVLSTTSASTATDKFISTTTATKDVHTSTASSTTSDADIISTLPTGPEDTTTVVIVSEPSSTPDMTLIVIIIVLAVVILVLVLVFIIWYKKRNDNDRKHGDVGNPNVNKKTKVYTKRVLDKDIAMTSESGNHQYETDHEKINHYSEIKEENLITIARSSTKDYTCLKKQTTNEHCYSSLFGPQNKDKTDKKNTDDVIPALPARLHSYQNTPEAQNAQVSYDDTNADSPNENGISRNADVGEANVNNVGNLQQEITAQLLERNINIL